MNLTEQEFMSLSNQMSDRDVKIAGLEEMVRQRDRELLVARAETEHWKQKFEEQVMANSAVELENQLLKNYLWLSWNKIKGFLSHVSDIKLIAFLQTFLQKTVSDSMGPKALETINKVVVLPEPDPKVNIEKASFSGPMYDITGNENVDLRGAGYGE